MLNKLLGAIVALFSIALLYSLPIIPSITIEVIALLACLFFFQKYSVLFVGKDFWRAWLTISVLSTVAIVLVTGLNNGSNLGNAYEYFRAAYSSIWICAIGVYWEIWSESLYSSSEDNESEK